MKPESEKKDGAKTMASEAKDSLALRKTELRKLNETNTLKVVDGNKTRVTAIDCPKPGIV